MDALTSKEVGHVKTLTKKYEFEFLTANFVKNGHFLVRNDLRSGLVCSFSKNSKMTLLTKRTNKTRSQVIPDPKKSPFSTKSAIKNPNHYFLANFLTCPYSLDVRPSTDVESGRKFQLEHD